MSFLKKALNHEVSIKRKYLPVITVLIVVALGVPVFLSFANGYYIPPSDPPSSVESYANGRGVPDCYSSIPQPVNSVACFNDVEAATDYAHSVIELGLGPVFNSTELNNLSQMNSISEQLLIITNKERIARGLAPVAGITQQLDQVAQATANDEETSVPWPSSLSGGVSMSWAGSNWCGLWNAYDCNYEWMYNDGPGGTNYYCQPGRMTDCWGHRNISLINPAELNTNGQPFCAAGKQLYMGGAYSTTTSSTNGSIAEVYVCANGTPSDVYLSWPTASTQLENNAALTAYENNPLPSIDGYWQVASDGGIFSYGNAQFHGSAGSIALNWPVVGMAPTPDGGGYWLVAADGGVFSYGDAAYHGSCGGGACGPTNGFFTGITAAPNGAGYWLTTSSGQIYSFGVPYLGGLPTANGVSSPTPIVGIAADKTSGGYWLTNTLGQVFAFGDATWRGNAPSGVSNVKGIAETPNGSGYWLVGSDGGVFAFGSNYYGSVPGMGASINNAVSISAMQDGGYIVSGADGANYWFSASGNKGYIPPRTLNKPIVGSAISGQAQAAILTTAPAVYIPPSVNNTVPLSPGPYQAVYAIGADGNLWQSEFTSNWTGWYSLGNPGVGLAGGVAYGINQVGYATVYATSVDGNVWQRAWTGGSWSTWTNLGNAGTAFTHGVAIGRNQINQPDLFAIAADGTVWEKYWTGATWSSWSSLGHGGIGTKGAISAGVDQNGNEVVFSNGSNGYVFESTRTFFGWSAWTNLGNAGVGLNNVSSSVDPSYHVLILYATGADGNVYDNVWTTSGWSGWKNQGKGSQALTSGISATKNQLNTTNIFAVGADGNVWQDWSNVTSWSGWFPLSTAPVKFTGPIASPPYPLPIASPPIISAISPASGSTFSVSKNGYVNISGVVYTGVGVKQIYISVNGAQIGTASKSTSPGYTATKFSYNWNLTSNKTGPLSPGTYLVTIQAQDSKGQTSQASISVNITQ